MVRGPTNTDRRPPGAGTAAAGPGADRRGPRRWSWNDVNFVLDALLLVMFAGLCVSSLIVRFVFPPGPVAGGWTLWGLDYDAWGGIQFGALAACVGGILLHLMFHWSWVCAMVAGWFGGPRRGRVDEGLQTIYGVGLLIVVLAVIGIPVAAAWLMVRGPA